MEIEKAKSENFLQSFNKKFELAYINIEKAENAFLIVKIPFLSALKNYNTSVFNRKINLRYSWIYNPGIYTAATANICKTNYDIHSPNDTDYLSNLKHEVLKLREGRKNRI